MTMYNLAVRLTMLWLPIRLRAVLLGTNEVIRFVNMNSTVGDNGSCRSISGSSVVSNRVTFVSVHLVGTVKELMISWLLGL